MDRCRLLLLIGSTAILILGAIVVLYADDPADGHAFPVCVFHELTGLHCPGCGTMRAIHRLLHGQVLAALRMNMLSVCLLPVLLFVTVRNWIAAWRGVPVQWHRPRWVPAGWRRGVVILVVGFGILRNVPLWPFTLLAPH